MCLKTKCLKLLDISNYVAPGFSYDQFLKAYECEQTKGFFPYEWVDGLDKLEKTSLPPHEAFFSSLKNQNITNEEYQYCQQVWEENEMSTFKDFLVWYNNLDVVPFLEAVEKMSAFWQERKIDMFKDGVSVPGLTLKYLFSYLSPQTYFSLCDKANSDLYHLIRDNNTGGPSIIFHRYHEASKTKIREAEKGQTAKLCEKIVGYDANALYLWALMQNMPTGSYTRRMAENEFKPKGSIRMAIEWLEWVAHKEGIYIRHQLNNTEKRIGGRKLPVDGFHVQTQTVYQFHGCYWHGHDCSLNRGKEFNDKRKKPMAELLEETRANTEYIKSKGCRVVEMWECEWRDMKKTNHELQRFIATEVRRLLDQVKVMSPERILSEVRNERLFGCVEVDIRVPDHLKEKFSEMCPIFKNTEISGDDIGDFMKAYAEEHNIMAQPRRSLIGSMKGEKILLATPLLKWYLEHGLEVTKVQILILTPEPCFKPFGDAVSDAGRAGDADPSKAIIADTMKLVSCCVVVRNKRREGKHFMDRKKKNLHKSFLISQVGNSGYGKTITNQLKHRDVEYCSDAEASRKVNTHLFRKLDNITEDTYEVESCKKTINLNLPIQVGFFVYQYAKLRMLQFYYDFLDKYLERADFQMCEMDTDSAYIAISGDSVESLVKPELTEEFQQDKCNWFPRTDTAEHKAYDKRTPGLFKVEWEGEGIIGLCSKTYYCFGAKDKFSCKGANKKTNEINKEKYLNVLLTKQNSAGVNRGFRVVNNAMYTYTQVRDAFSYFYPKRKVLADGVSTTPLDI